jgi:hypothetical protein
VDVSIISMLVGPGHCGWESALMLTMGWPIGEKMHSRTSRQFVRDPEHLFADQSLAEYLPSVRLPADAYFSELTYGEDELWVSNDTIETRIFVVRSDVVEQWPRVRERIGCM